MPLTWLGSCMVPRAGPLFPKIAYEIYTKLDHIVSSFPVSCAILAISMISQCWIQEQTLRQSNLEMECPRYAMFDYQRGKKNKPAGFRETKTKLDHLTPNPQTEYLHCLTFVTCLVEVCVFFWIQSQVSIFDHYWKQQVQLLVPCLFGCLL